MTITTTHYGRAALDALSDAVAAAKHADPMAPVTVLAPSNLAGIVARRHLAAGVGGRPGVAGLEVTTLPRLAERIAAPLLAPRRPATRTVLAAAFRQALANAPGRFEQIAQHPATVRSLVRAYTELRDLEPAGRAAVASASVVGAEVVALHDAVAARLAADWYDTSDLLTTAATRIDAVAGGSVILYVPQRLSRGESAFVQALGGVSDLTVIAALTRASRADAAVLRTVGAVTAPGDPATAHRVITASDSDDEVRAVVRDVITTLQTTPAHRIAVLYSAPVPYARLLHDQLGAAGLTVNGAGVSAVDERAVSRALLGLLELAGSDVPRADLFRALSAVPARDFDGERIPLSSWERLSRAAGIVRGEDWDRRLTAYIADRHGAIASEQTDTDPREWLIARTQRQIAQAGALHTFATRLRAEFERATAMTIWRELADWAQALFTTVIASEQQVTRLPAAEQYAAAAISGLLRSLAGLDAVEPGADYTTLVDVLGTELATTLPRVGRFGDGVFVGPVSAAVGLDVDTVFVVGLSEDLYPGRIAPDALLSDRARAVSDLPGSSDRLYARYRELLACFEAGREVVACFPRGDLRRSSHRLPSRWLLSTLRELSGDHELAAVDWQDAEYSGAVTNQASFAAGLLQAPDPASAQEWRVRQAASGDTLDDGVVADALAMITAHRSVGFTRFDGNLSGVGDLPDYAHSDCAISPTALEDFTACPHAFFVKRLLNVEPVEQPEDVITISALDIGNLVHSSVEKLVLECADDLPGPGQPWTVEQHDRLMQISLDTAEQFQARGLTGHPRLWEVERERIVRDVGQLLAADDAYRADRMAEVLASEMAFGMRGAPPVRIPLDDGRVLMRGSADLVERSADGTLHVIDIKTGGTSRYDDITPADPLAGATKLQLPVYAYAARQQYGEADTDVRASYWFVRRDNKRKSVELTPDLDAAYRRALSVITRSILGGAFPARAPQTADFGWIRCAYCNPDGLGHGELRRRWEIKRHDPALRQFVGLVEPDVHGAGAK